MRALFLLLVCLAAGPGSAMAGKPAASPAGHWFFYKKIYRGHEMPEPPEATLRLFYEFGEEGRSRLYWWHEGENDRCEREGRYVVEGDLIVEKATWVDPGNHPSCSRDPDMQEGKISRTRFELIEGELHLYLPLAEEFLVYVWKRANQ